ncbi:acyl-CoA dehydrogenase family protein [Yinghuangia aomiensis]
MAATDGRRRSAGVRTTCRRGVHREPDKCLAAVVRRPASTPTRRTWTGLDEPFERRVLGAAAPRRAGHRAARRGPGGSLASGGLRLRGRGARRSARRHGRHGLAGFSVAAFANREQRAFFLPRMTGGELASASPTSEREAEGDLRALSATAVEDGRRLRAVGRRNPGHRGAQGGLVLHGGPYRVAGAAAMTMFLVDMAAPGVRVVRRPTMNGWTLDEVRFDAVRLPPGAVLGEPGRAWRQLAAALQAERSGMFYLGFARRALNDLRRHLRETGGGDPVARDAFAALEVDFTAGRALGLPGALRGPQERRGGRPGVDGQVFATELLQRIAQEATETAGHQGMIHAPLFAPEPPPAAARGRFAWEYLERVHGTIGAGANELQRDTIAQAGLGLPTARRK